MLITAFLYMFDPKVTGSLVIQNIIQVIQNIIKLSLIISDNVILANASFFNFIRDASSWAILTNSKKKKKKNTFKFLLLKATLKALKTTYVRSLVIDGCSIA